MKKMMQRKHHVEKQKELREKSSALNYVANGSYCFLDVPAKSWSGKLFRCNVWIQRPLAFFCQLKMKLHLIVFNCFFENIVSQVSQRSFFQPFFQPFYYVRFYRTFYFLSIFAEIFFSLVSYQCIVSFPALHHPTQLKSILNRPKA